MSLSGRCPFCHNTLALSEATVGDARTDMSESRAGVECQCDCGERLLTHEIPPVGEIELQCHQCGTQYVVDRDGAGEMLDCRCGASNQVPNVLLVPLVTPVQSRPVASDVSVDEVSPDSNPPETNSPDSVSMLDHNVLPQLEQQDTDVPLPELSRGESKTQYSVSQMEMANGALRWSLKNGRGASFGTLPTAASNTAASNTGASDTVAPHSFGPRVPSSECGTTYRSAKLTLSANLIRWNLSSGKAIRSSTGIAENVRASFAMTTVSQPSVKYSTTRVEFARPVARWNSKCGKQSVEIPSRAASLEDTPAIESKVNYSAAEIRFTRPVIQWSLASGKRIQTEFSPVEEADVPTEDKVAMTHRVTYSNITIQFKRPVATWSLAGGKQEIAEQTLAVPIQFSYKTARVHIGGRAMRWTLADGRHATPARAITNQEPTPVEDACVPRVQYSVVRIAFEASVPGWSLSGGKRDLPEPADLTDVIEPNDTNATLESTVTYSVTRISLADSTVRWSLLGGRWVRADSTHDTSAPNQLDETTESTHKLVYSAASIQMPRDCVRWSSITGRQPVTEPPPIVDHKSTTQTSIQVSALPRESISQEVCSDSVPEPRLSDRAADVRPAAGPMVQVGCPGCGRSYEVPRAELGQTGECQCGFVFQLIEIPSATDIAVLSDLMPHLPLAIDRTGNLPSANGQSAKRKPSAEPSIARKSKREKTDARPGKKASSRSGNGWRVLLSLGAVVLVTVSSYWWHKHSAPVEHYTSLASLPDRPARPIPTQHGEPVERSNPIATASHEEEKLAGLREIAKELIAADSLGRDQLFEFARSVEEFGEQHSNYSVLELFWIGETWEQLGQRAQSDDLAKKCFWQASAAYALAKTVESIAPPQLKLASDRHSELSARSQQHYRIAERPEESGTP